MDTSRIGYVICETDGATSKPVVVEQKSNRVIAEGTLQDANIKNRNGRIYSDKELFPELKSPRTTELIESGNLCGEAGHPMDSSLVRQQTIDPTKVAVKYLKLWTERDLIIYKTAEDLSLNYNCLRPEAYVNIANVEIEDGINDVITCVYKASDTNTPYGICRQMVFDVHDLVEKDDLSKRVGCSVSVDNCPENVNFLNLMACNGVKEYNVIACYRDDTIDTIIDKISDTVSYHDKILEELYEMNKTACESLHLTGFQKTLKDLWIYNNFKIELMNAMNILPITFEIEIDDNNHLASLEIIEKMEIILRQVMVDHYVLKYDYTINLNDIEVSYVLVSDPTDTVYLIGYTNGGIKDRSEEDEYKKVRSMMNMCNDMADMIKRNDK